MVVNVFNGAANTAAGAPPAGAPHCGGPAGNFFRNSLAKYVFLHKTVSLFASTDWAWTAPWVKLSVHVLLRLVSQQHRLCVRVHAGQGDDPGDLGVVSAAGLQDDAKT